MALVTQGRTVAPRMAASLARVSASSTAGSLPGRTPTPANTRARVPLISAERIPTAHGPLPDASTQPTGPDHRPARFETLVHTPHGTAITALVHAYGIPAESVSRVEELASMV